MVQSLMQPSLGSLAEDGTDKCSQDCVVVLRVERSH